jgi:hypothetical protein
MIDTARGWKTNEGFALGVGTNRLPAEDLTSTTLEVKTDSGLELRCAFLSAGEVRWGTTGVEDLDAATGSDPYDAVAVGEHALFVDLPFRSRPRQALTLMISNRTRRALVVVSTIAPGPIPGEPQVNQRFWPGVVGGGDPVPRSFVPAPTRDLIGRRLLHRYSPNHCYEHVHLSSERYAWQCLEGLQRGHGDVDLASTYQLDDDLYVFAVREIRIAVASLFLYDMVGRTSTGRFLSLAADGHAEHRRFGSRIIPLADVRYPDVEPV